MTDVPETAPPLPRFKAEVIFEDLPDDEESGEKNRANASFHITKWEEGAGAWVESSVDALVDTPALGMFMTAWKPIEALQERLKAAKKRIILPPDAAPPHTNRFKSLVGRGKGKKRKGR